jgi:protocatechuate 3,4-dioxygenase, alpha subunit
MPGTTPSQTVGPFFSIGLAGIDAVAPGTPGVLRLHGTVFDGGGDAVPDAVVETWQTVPAPAFGRALCDERGRWSIMTLKPGPDAAGQAPHVDVSVFARGLLQRVVTRIYFADEPTANAADRVLAGIGDERARATLLARPDGDGYRFDIHLQGDDETVFFAV